MEQKSIELGFTYTTENHPKIHALAPFTGIMFSIISLEGNAHQHVKYNLY